MWMRNFVKSIIDHEETGQNLKNWKFWVRWSGYETDEVSWLNWNAVKDPLGCIGQVQSRPFGTQIGLKIVQESIGKGCYPGKRIFFYQVLQ